MPCMNENSSTNRVVTWLSTGLGIGMATPAPGTVGGLWGIPLAWAIWEWLPLGSQVPVILVLGLISVAICSRAAKLFGDYEDPQEIVLDEIVALPVVFYAVGIPNWQVLLAGWLLFRLFDITKPPPARQAERLPSGWGIMADDFVAAIYACLALHASLWLDGMMGWGVMG